MPRGQNNLSIGTKIKWRDENGIHTGTFKRVGAHGLIVVQPDTSPISRWISRSAIVEREK